MTNAEKMTINGLVNTIKVNGLENATEEFGQVYERLVDRVEAKAISYLNKRELKMFHIDHNDLVSYALWEYLQMKIEAWDGETGEFAGFFFRYIQDAFSTAIRPYFRMKEQPNMKTTDIDRQIDSETTLADILEDKQEEQFSELFCEVLEGFADTYGEQAKNIILCYSAGSKTQQTKTMCRILGVDKFNSASRKKVQRIKNNFKTFAKERLGY